MHQLGIVKRHIQHADPAAVTLDAGVLQRLDALINRQTVSGARDNPATQAEIATEEFA